MWNGPGKGAGRGLQKCGNEGLRLMERLRRGAGEVEKRRVPWGVRCVGTWAYLLQQSIKAFRGRPAGPQGRRPQRGGLWLANDQTGCGAENGARALTERRASRSSVEATSGETLNALKVWPQITSLRRALCSLGAQPSCSLCVHL